MPGPLVENHEIAVEDIELVCLAFQVLDSAEHRFTNDGIFVCLLMGNTGFIPFGDVLVNSALRIEGPERSLEVPADVIQSRMVEAVVIAAVDFNYHTHISALGQKHVIVYESEQVHERVRFITVVVAEPSCFVIACFTRFLVASLPKCLACIRMYPNLEEHRKQTAALRNLVPKRKVSKIRFCIFFSGIVNFLLLLYLKTLNFRRKPYTF